MKSLSTFTARSRKAFIVDSLTSIAVWVGINHLHGHHSSMMTVNINAFSTPIGPKRMPRRNSNNDGLPIVIPTQKEDVLLWTHDIDEDAKAQFIRVAESGIATGPVAAMPDAHLGKGVTIGTVFASDRYVCPNAVGVDIGCGMAAVPIEGLYKGDLSLEVKQDIHSLIKDRIPTGTALHTTPLNECQGTLDRLVADVSPTDALLEILNDKNERVQKQFGTLGGGNHFIELVYDEDTQQVWVMLHSGSRGLGHRIATHYDGLAKEWLTGRMGADQVKNLKGLHYMEIESPNGQNYLTDMEFCQRYAFENRAAMLRTVLDIVKYKTGKTADLDHAVNIHHNYCVLEEIEQSDGVPRKLWITRKGATSAKKGEMGIIPGSMGTGSFITRGLGNSQSWSSSAHGAGRTMSRTTAREEISQEDFEKSMEGIVCETTPHVRDEAPQAYKDLTQVMADQSSLTEIIHHLLPLVNVKGIEPIKPKNRSKEEYRAALLEQKQQYIKSLNDPAKRSKTRYLQRIQKRLNEVEDRLVSLDE